MRPLAPLLAGFLSFAATAHASTYAVVVSDRTYADAGWRKVVDALVEKHAAKVITPPEGRPEAAREALAALRPEYTAFVARPDECGRVYAATIFRTVRALDADPYEDTVWGIVTGADADATLRQVRTGADVVVRNGIGTTGLTESRFQKLYVQSDAGKGAWILQSAPGKIEKGEGHGRPDDVAWAARFTELQPQLVVTSAHGFQDGVEMPYSRGMIRTHEGSLRVVGGKARHGNTGGGATSGKKSELDLLPEIPADDTPRAWLAAGNCLTGHCHTPSSLVAVTMSRYGVKQFHGFSVVSWYGYVGWGSLGLFLDGRHDVTMGDACWFVRQRLIGDLARMAPVALAWTPAFDETDATGNNVGAFFNAVGKAGLIPKAADSEVAKRIVGHLWERDTFVPYGDPALRVSFPREVKPDAAKLSLTRVSGKRLRFVAEWPASAVRAGIPPLGFRFREKFAVAPRAGEGAPADLILADDFLLVPAPKPDATGRVSFELEEAPAAN